jgi:hypothetical protein
MQATIRRVRFWFYHALALALLSYAALGRASEQRGQVIFNGLPVPGATITATQGAKKLTTITDTNGYYRFADLPDGAWKIEVSMLFFAPQEQSVTVAANEPGIRWELKMLPVDQVIAQAKVIKAPTIAAPPPADVAKSDNAKAPAAEAPRLPSENASQANDGFLVNGSVNNAATSQYSLAQAFGNTRSSRSLYNGGLGLVLDNSAFDAKPYSLSGQQTPKSDYNTVTLFAALGGPVKIPHLLPRGPNFFLQYQWSRSNNAVVIPGLVPTAAQRAGILTNGTISPISPQAAALLALYPLPNLAGNTQYNYQVPVLNSSHLDLFQARLDKSVGRRDSFNGIIAFQNIRASNGSLFGFTDTTGTLGINDRVSWIHRLNHAFNLNTTYSFSRLRTLVTPYFANRSNISGAAGVNGNDQDPANWGPPTLTFSSGIAPLTDGISAFNRNRTESVSEVVSWYHGRHNVDGGADFRRQEYNYLSQQNPRGTFTFTGAATGNSDFADFLHGTPDASQIAFGNADKYLRQSVYDAYIRDDWRVRPELTLNVGLRWEYGAPITELKNRLVNLDVAQDFSAATPVLASSPVGSLTGQHLPTSLIRPTKNRFEPRLSASWRPIAGSSLVVRAGYGVYSDTSVYQATALQMAQQAPLSKSLSVQNSAACPLTLATGFNPCSNITTTTFAVDPNFRVGYAHVWQLSLQKDLPAALQMTVNYLGTKGTRGVQEFYPNTYPAGGTNPCPQCPVGFLYRTSNGDSTRNAGSVQLRRRLRSGFTASALYTYAKSIDNDSVLGGQGPVANGATVAALPTPVVAQNWRDLRAERSRSNFDQRHTLVASFQYTSGMGLGGGTLLGGWRGRVLKEWTVLGNINVATGLPETPIYVAVLNGTGATSVLRPNVTSVSVYNPPAGRYLNANAYAAPAAGQFGNASRNSINGPGQFAFDMSLARTFRLDKKLNLDVRADVKNILNHPVFTNYNSTLSPPTAGAPTLALSSPVFGLPTAANPMRTMQLTMNLKF